MAEADINGENEVVEAAAGAPEDASAEWLGAGRATWALAFVLLAVRVIWLVALCPYELAADEAHYWEWARRPALSYYAKGPGVAWTLWLFTKAFGDSVWAIRLPAALASFLATLGVARLAADGAQGVRGVGFRAAVLFNCVPVFFAFGHFMTIDGPLVACWTWAAWAGWRAFRLAWADERGSRYWLLLGLMLGVGFLFKYSILLMVPGFVAFGIWSRPRTAARGGVLGGAMGAMAVFLVVISPVIVWNAHNGWPSISHLLGRISVPGGDVAAGSAWTYNPLWTLGYLASPLAFLGPPMAVLLTLASVAAMARGVRESVAWPHRVYLLALAAPAILFYLLLSFGTNVELTWPAAGYVTLVALGALYAAGSGVWGGGANRAARLWPWCVGAGVAAAAAVLVGGHLLLAAAKTQRFASAGRLMHRLSGQREFAARVQAEREALAAAEGRPPALIADHYGTASLLAYYLPDRPAIGCAAPFMGGRRSAYDYFRDTDLRAEAWQGRTVLLAGGSEERWRRAMSWDRLEPVAGEARLFRGFGYGVPRVGPTAHPPAARNDKTETETTAWPMPVEE